MSFRPRCQLISPCPQTGRRSAAAAAAASASCSNISTGGTRCVVDAKIEFSHYVLVCMRLLWHVRAGAIYSLLTGSAIDSI